MKGKYASQTPAAVHPASPGSGVGTQPGRNGDGYERSGWVWELDLRGAGRSPAQEKDRFPLNPTSKCTYLARPRTGGAPFAAAPYGDASQRLGGPKTSICLSDFEVIQRI